MTSTGVRWEYKTTVLMITYLERTFILTVNNEVSTGNNIY
jgi:hypothetical protein